MLHGGGRLIAPQISDNVGQGLYLSNGSNALVSGAIIARNTRHGIALLQQSSANFGWPATSVSASGLSDIFCDAAAVLQYNQRSPGDTAITGANVVNCPTQVVNLPPGF
jgi:hypothetical protein